MCGTVSACTRDSHEDPCNGIRRKEGKLPAALCEGTMECMLGFASPSDQSLPSWHLAPEHGVGEEGVVVRDVQYEIRRPWRTQTFVPLPIFR